MEYSFARYLLAKRTVDDRALNRGVFDALVASLPAGPVSIVEVGAGIGTMLTRLVEWEGLSRADYVMVDEMPENIEYARAWLPQWARAHGLTADGDGDGDELRIHGEGRDLRVRLVRADVFNLLATSPPPADLLIAHAFLDLVPMPDGLARLLTLARPEGLAWMTINFDGVTTFEPGIDPALDAQIERLYHATMDSRPTGGDSRSGRHLFGHLGRAGAKIIAAGPSDWVVFAQEGRYPADEAYFLHFILHFFEDSLARQPGLDPAAFAHWLAERSAQIDRGDLVYVAHQMDFLARLPR